MILVDSLINQCNSNIYGSSEEPFITTKKRSSVVGTVLIVLAILLLAYTVLSIVNTHIYITALVESGQATLEGHFYDVLNTYMQSSALYFLFAILFAVIGLNSYGLLGVRVLTSADTGDDDSLDYDSLDDDLISGYDAEDDDEATDETSDIEFDDISEDSDDSDDSDDTEVAAEEDEDGAFDADAGSDKPDESDVVAKSEE